MTPAEETVRVETAISVYVEMTRRLQTFLSGVASIPGINPVAGALFRMKVEAMPML